MPVLVCLLFTLTMVADSIVLLAGVVPLALGRSGARLGRVTGAGDGGPPLVQLQPAQARLRSPASPVGSRQGNARSGRIPGRQPVEADTGLGQLQHGAWVTFRAFLELFGANVFNASFFGARPVSRVCS